MKMGVLALSHIPLVKELSFTWVILGMLIGLLPVAASGALYVRNRLTEPPKYTVENNQIFIPSNTESQHSEVIAPPSKALLPGTKWIAQTFNNCGPATTSMVLAYFGYNVDQNTTKAALRTNSDDKNVFTYEMRDYLHTYGIGSKIFYNGDIQLLKTLVANGFYVVAEDWLHPNEDIGHVTILRGYDDEKGVFIADDSFIGNNIVYKYEEFDTTQWKAFNREYLPVYRPEQERLLKKIVGENWDERVMFQNAVKRAEAEIALDSKDMYAYFNLGTSLYALDEYDRAAEAFKKSQSIGWPKRMLWYQIQPVQTLNELGRYQDAIEMANRGLWANDSFAELHYEKARAYKGLGNSEQAKAEIDATLKYSPNFQKAKDFSL